jgi:hypothetical protein
MVLLTGFKVEKKSDRARFHTRAFRSFFKPIAKDQEKQFNRQFSLNLKWEIDWGIIDRFDIGSGYTMEENKQRFIGLYFNPLRKFLIDNPFCSNKFNSVDSVKVRWGERDELILEKEGPNLILTQRFRRANYIGLYDGQQRTFAARLKKLLSCDGEL